MNHIVEVDELERLINGSNLSRLKIIDCRFSLTDPGWGENEYKKGHIPGALYAHLEKDLSGEVQKHGGRHPLPDDDAYEQMIRSFGIDKESIVVIYDQGGAPFASRLWWMLKYAKIRQVFVLNGGIEAWKKANLPISQETPLVEPSTFVLEKDESIIAHIDEVRTFVEKRDDQVILIDSREEKRYKGEYEPIDNKAGHIPGAINVPWQEGINEFRFATIDKQLKRFSPLDPNKEIIVYCGSGVTAAPNVLLLKEAGFKHVKLYVGSFSDWISYEDHEIETN